MPWSDTTIDRRLDPGVGLEKHTDGGVDPSVGVREDIPQGRHLLVARGESNSSG